MRREGPRDGIVGRRVRLYEGRFDSSRRRRRSVTLRRSVKPGACQWAVNDGDRTTTAAAAAAAAAVAATVTTEA